MRETHLLSMFLFAVSICSGQDPCAAAPDDDVRVICRQIQELHKAARRTDAAPPIPQRTPTQTTSVIDCRSILCVCPFVRGTVRQGACVLSNGQIFGRVLRKEYRVLTDDERNRFHRAMWAVKSSGMYDYLARIHARSAFEGGAHAGPAFLPWHRELLKRLEFALRVNDPSVAIPYWDSVLDRRIPNPRESVMWSSELLGGFVPGDVNDGAFRGWRLENYTRVIRRRVGGRSNPISDANLTTIFNTNNFQDLLAYTAAEPGCPRSTSFMELEYAHGGPHNFVGEDMVLTASSANDPAFYLHHSFVDYIWELWRLRKQAVILQKRKYILDGLARPENCKTIPAFI